MVCPATTRIETSNEEDRDIGIRITDLFDQKEIGRGQFGSVYKYVLSFCLDI